MNIEIQELKNLLQICIVSAIEMYKSECDQNCKPYLNKTKAYELYGRSNVDRWLLEGLVKPYKDGEGTSHIRLNRLELAKVAFTSNRATYLSKAELKVLRRKNHETIQ